MVQPADERGQCRHGPDHGELGPRPGHCRCTRGRAEAQDARLRHIAHLGVHTFAFSFALHGLDVPTTPVRVELGAPDGSVWAWGDPTADEFLVRGPALDFCLVVTQRRHVADTALVTKGTVAGRWLAIAQAFAGPAGEGRPPFGADHDG